MQKGYVTVRAFTREQISPVSGASVYIVTNGENGEKNIERLLITDENGKTPVIEIDAPDIELTETPDYTGTPYTLIDIFVYRDAFYTIKVEDVQVFADRVTVQNIEMIPLPENFNEVDDVNVFVVKPQNL